MSEGLEIAIGALGFLLLAASVYGFVVGCEAALSGERLARCPRCHRRGWTSGNVVHPRDCPTGLLQHVTHPAHHRAAAALVAVPATTAGHHRVHGRVHLHERRRLGRH